MRARRFIKNAIILCVTSVALRLIWLYFNAYLVRVMGASGIGLFQLVMSVYMLFITMASSGIGMATTRLVAEALAKGRMGIARCVLKRTLIYSIVFGSIAAVVMYTFAEYIGLKWLGDARTVSSLRILALGLPCIAMSSILKGYFTAVRRISKSAAVDVAEQLFRMAAIVFFATFVFSEGLESACMAIALGSTLAEVLSFGLLYILHILDRRKHGVYAGRAVKAPSIAPIALPVAVNAYLRAGFSSVSKLLVPTTLERHGLSKDASLAQYGMIQGMVFPILQLPEMFLLSFASLLVPELTDLQANKNKRSIARSLDIVFRATFFFSIAAIGLLSRFAKDISMLVYSDASITLYLASLAPLALFMYLDRVVDCSLTGLNEQVNSMLNNLVESVLNTILIILLVPRFGMMGYIAVLYIGKTVNMWLSFARLTRVSEMNIPFVSWILCPLAAVLLSMGIIGLICTLFARELPWGLLALMQLCLYTLLLWMMGCLKKRK